MAFYEYFTSILPTLELREGGGAHHHVLVSVLVLAEGFGPKLLWMIFIVLIRKISIHMKCANFVLLVSS
jgi:hypothetical protein